MTEEKSTDTTPPAEDEAAPDAPATDDSAEEVPWMAEVDGLGSELELAIGTHFVVGCDECPAVGAHSAFFSHLEPLYNPGCNEPRPLQ